jgi:hypothetical protein
MSGGGRGFGDERSKEPKRSGTTCVERKNAGDSQTSNKITVLFIAVVLATSLPAMAQSEANPNAIESRFAEVEGIKLHYLTAGHGPSVILLHGYTQTSRMWRPLIPKLAEKFTSSRS